MLNGRASSPPKLLLSFQRRAKQSKQLRSRASLRRPTPTLLTVHCWRRSLPVPLSALRSSLPAEPGTGHVPAPAPPPPLATPPLLTQPPPQQQRQRPLQEQQQQPPPPPPPPQHAPALRPHTRTGHMHALANYSLADYSLLAVFSGQRALHLVERRLDRVPVAGGAGAALPHRGAPAAPAVALAGLHEGPAPGGADLHGAFHPAK